MEFNSLSDAYYNYSPPKDSEGNWVLPFQGGRFRLTENFDVIDTGFIDRYPNILNGFLNYQPNPSQIAPRVIYERNTSIAIKNVAFNIPDMSPMPLNLTYLYLLVMKPIYAPDATLGIPNFKVNFVNSENINNDVLDANDMEWSVNSPVSFIAYNGRSYRLTPSPIQAVLDNVSGKVRQMVDGRAMVEGTNRPNLFFNCLGGKVEVSRANFVALSEGMISVSSDKVYGFNDQDINNISKFNIIELPRTVSDVSYAVADASYDFVVHEGDSSLPQNASQPKADFTFTSNELEVTFTDISSDDVAVTGYNWDLGDGNTSTVANPVHTYAAEGLYRVSLRVNDADANVSYKVTKTVQVKNNMPPQADFMYSENFLVVSFTDTSIDHDGTIAGYEWDFGDGNNSTDQNPTHVYGAAGAYIVTLKVTDDDGAASAVYKQTISIVDNERPVANWQHVSKYLQTSFTDLSTDGDGTITAWSWDFGGDGTSNAQHPTHTFSAAGDYTVSLTVTDEHGMDSTVASALITVVANEKPVASFTKVVNHREVSFTDTSTDAENSVVTRNWDFGDGNSSPLRNPVHTYATDGTFTVSLTVTDEDGLDSDPVTEDITVVANVPPTADFTYVADDLDVDFTDTSTDSDGTVVSWFWTFGDGAQSNQQSPSHSYAAAGDYNVSLIVIDDDGEASVAKQETVTVVANVPPTASFTYNAEYLEVEFIDGSTDGDGTIVSYLWDFGDTNMSNRSNPTHTYNTNGTYTVSLMVTDDDGVQSTAFEETITVAANVPPTASFTEVVDHGEVTFTSNAMDGDGVVTSYAWDFGDGNNSVFPNPTHTYGASGTYTVQLVVTDDQGLQSSPFEKMVSVLLNQAPIAQYTYLADKLNVDFSDSSNDPDGTVVAWDWDFNGEGTSNQQNPSFTFPAAGAKTVRLIVTDDDGAQSTAYERVITVIANVAPVANFTFQVTGNDVAFTDTSTDYDGAVVAWAWDFDDNGATSTLQNPTHTFPGPGTYNVKLTVTDNDNEDSTQVAIDVTIV